MLWEYNPIVRTFCRLRREFVNALGVPRRQVRPRTPLATLIPVVKRREVWRRLRREGFRVPALELSTPAALSSTLLVLKLSAAFASWLQSRLATCVIVPIGFIIFRVNRRWAVHFPENWLTVGELALRLTPFGDHMGSGGWWTQEDISQKVRLVLAECLNIDAKDIRPESTLRELGAE